MKIKYIDVISYWRSIDYFLPLAIIWENGKHYRINKLLSKRLTKLPQLNKEVESFECLNHNQVKTIYYDYQKKRYFVLLQRKSLYNEDGYYPDLDYPE